MFTQGAALSKGKIKGNCIQCPFHGLEFDREGACKFIPANGKASIEDLTRYNVKSYHVKESYGIIYLWYGDEAVKENLPFFENDIDNSYVYSELSISLELTLLKMY